MFSSCEDEAVSPNLTQQSLELYYGISLKEIWSGEPHAQGQDRPRYLGKRSVRHQNLIAVLIHFHRDGQPSL